MKDDNRKPPNKSPDPDANRINQEGWRRRIRAALHLLMLLFQFAGWEKPPKYKAKPIEPKEPKHPQLPKQRPTADELNTYRNKIREYDKEVEEYRAKSAKFEVENEEYEAWVNGIVDLFKQQIYEMCEARIRELSNSSNRAPPNQTRYSYDLSDVPSTSRAPPNQTRYSYDLSDVPSTSRAPPQLFRSYSDYNINSPSHYPNVQHQVPHYPNAQYQPPHYPNIQYQAPQNTLPPYPSNNAAYQQDNHYQTQRTNNNDAFLQHFQSNNDLYWSDSSPCHSFDDSFFEQYSPVVSNGQTYAQLNNYSGQNVTYPQQHQNNYQQSPPLQQRPEPSTDRVSLRQLNKVDSREAFKQPAAPKRKQSTGITPVIIDQSRPGASSSTAQAQNIDQSRPGASSSTAQAQNIDQSPSSSSTVSTRNRPRKERKRNSSSSDEDEDE